MEPKLVTVMLALTAVACFVGGAFVPHPTAQNGLFMLATYLLGIITVSKPADQPKIAKAKMWDTQQKIRGHKP